jgi:parallel beta-helix repeat protein
MSKKIVVLLFVVSALLTIRYATAGTYTDVLVTTAKNMICSNPSLIILDVRNQSEYDAGHIRNAKLIPLYQLAGRLDELNKTDETLVYCKAGGRSATASQLLADNNFSHVYNILGGFDVWNTTGYPYYVKYSSIQEAINGASEGKSILVSSGLYYEHVIVNKSISLMGENKYKTTVDGFGNGTIFQVEADNVSISDFTIRRCGCSCEGFSGIYVKPSHQNLNITDNNILPTGNGIELSWTRKAILARNNITESSFAIVANNSSDVSISANLITLNSDGIDLSNSTHINISENTIYNNAYGLYISWSNNNSVVSNRFDSNTVFGIFNDGQSANNSVFHNNFVSNAFDVSTMNSTIFWDNGYPSGGNYWSNYIDVDLYGGTDQNETGADGIWDRPYDCIMGKDNYPLKGPFNTFLAGTWNETAHNVDVISNSTVSSFSFNSSAHPPTLSFNIEGEQGTSGFCRVAIPKCILWCDNSNEWIITVSGETMQQPGINEYGNYTYLYFEYIHSSKTVQILGTHAVPESISILVVPLFMTMSLFLLAIRHKNRKKTVLPRSS